MIDETLRQELLSQHRFKELMGYHTTRFTMGAFGNNNRYSSGKLIQEGDIILSFTAIPEENINNSETNITLNVCSEENISLRIDEIEEYSKKYTFVAKALGITFAQRNSII